MKAELKDLILNNVNTDEVLLTSHDLYDHLNYSGLVDELIDSSIDIYYYDLRKWAVDNYDFIDQAISDGIAGGDDDFHKLIQMGQYVSLSEDAHTYLEELFEENDGKLFNIKEVA